MASYLVHWCTDAYIAYKVSALGFMSVLAWRARWRGGAPTAGEEFGLARTESQRIISACRGPALDV